MGRQRGIGAGIEHVLREHFATEEADSGLRSSFGTMIDMAMSGIPRGGRQSYEGAINGGRHGWGGSDRVCGDDVEEPIGSALRHRRARRALQQMKPSGGRSPADLRGALFLAFGAVSWPAIVEETYKAASAPAVILLTRAAARAFERSVHKASQERSERLTARGLGEWLRLPSVREDADLVKAICEEATDILRAALDSFIEAYRGPTTAVRGRRERGAGRILPSYFQEVRVV